MTASTDTIQFTHPHHHGLQPVEATRRTNVIAVLCITAFVAWCVMPAVVWAAQLGLAAWSDNRSGEPPQLPSCAAPTATTPIQDSMQDRLIELERKS